MGSKTTSQVTNAANPDAQAAYTNVVGQAQSVAATPYQPYTGQLVAGLNGGQDASIGQLRGAYGAAQPYVDAGAGDLSSGAQGLGAVQPYLQAGSDATAGAGGYQGLGSASFGQAGGYAGQSAAALAGMQPYMGAASGSIGSASGAFGQEQAGLGAAQGYFGQAASLATPQSFDASAVQQYMSPYLSSVVGATQANLQENDRQQAEGLTSSAIGSGAYGGDRAGVAQAELSRQQDLADGQTIAGLHNTGYSNAEGQFNAAQGQRQQGASLLAGLGSATTQNALGYGSVGQGDLASASGYNALAQDQGQQAQQFGTLGNLANATGSGYTGLASDSLGQASAYGTLGQLQGTTGQAYGTMAGIAGNLGSTEQSNLISGASAGLQGSTLGQQNQQQQDTAAYNQYMAGLSYPYQNVGFLSNIVQGIGSQEGNTQTTQGNALSSIAGLGTSAIGILGATGGFGANGYLSGLGSSVSSAFSDARVKDDIASIGTTHDGQPIYRFRYKGDPKVQMGLMAQDVEKRDPGAVGEAGGIKTVDYDRATAGAAALGLGARPGDPRPQRAMGGPVGLGMSPVGGSTMPGATPMGLGARPQMTAPQMATAGAGLGARPRFDAGGTVDTDAAIPSGGISFNGVPGSGSAGLGAGGLNTSASGLTNGAATAHAPQGLGGARPALLTMPPTSPQYAVASPVSFNGNGSAGLGSTSFSGGSSSGAGLGATQSPSSDTFSPGAASGQDSSGQAGLGAAPSSGGLSQNAWMGVLAAGLGMMEGTSASGLANVGAGASKGLQTYLGLQQQDRNNAVQQGELALRGRQADQTAAYQTGSLALDKQKEDFTEKRTQMMMDAAQRASDTLAGITAPSAAAAQGATSAPSGGSSVAPTPLQNGATGASVSAVSGATPNGAPAAGGWMSNTIPGSAAPVPTAPASASSAAPQPAPQSAAPAPQAAGSDFWSKVSPDSNPILMTRQAAQYQAAGKQLLAMNPEGANQLFSQASTLQNRARQIYDTGKVMMSDGSVGPLPGFNATAAATSAATEQAKAGVQNQNDLVPVQPTPGGPTQYVTKAQALQTSTGQNGQPGAPLTKEQPAYLADKQKQMGTNEIEMDQQFQQRQVSLQRINDLQAIQQKFQTGDLAGAKADAVAFGRAIGIPVNDSVTSSPQLFQQFGKDAVGNVFSDLKAAGGRPMVAEIDGLMKANANAEMSPGANAAILAQGKGIINYQDQHYKDYLGWKQQNPYATDPGQFDTSWATAHPLGSFVDQAKKDTAYQGQVIPPDPTQRTAGQMYMTPKGPMRWSGNGWAAN